MRTHARTHVHTQVNEAAWHMGWALSRFVWSMAMTLPRKPQHGKALGIIPEAHVT